MKHSILVLIAALLLLVACNGRPMPQTHPLTGEWSGMAVATWPGDADQSVTDSGRIIFEFLDNGQYRFEQLTNLMHVVDQAEGNFSFFADSIVLSQTAGSISSLIFTIAGTLHFDSNADTIFLTQVLRPGGWSESHTVTLTMGIVPPIETLCD